MSAEFFMTSYFRHAPVGGKQVEIQPEWNQYGHSPNLLGFCAEQSSAIGSISCCCKIQFSFCLGVHTIRQRNKKALIRKERRRIEEGKLPYSPVMTPPLAPFLCAFEVVLRVPYFKSPPTDLRHRRWRYFTHRLKQDVDFWIEGAINSHRHEGRRIKQSLPGKLHLAPLAHFSRANFVIYKFSS